MSPDEIIAKSIQRTVHKKWVGFGGPFPIRFWLDLPKMEGITSTAVLGALQERAQQAKERLDGGVASGVLKKVLVNEPDAREAGGGNIHVEIDVFIVPFEGEQRKALDFVSEQGF